jgi:hypothetical protein
VWLGLGTLALSAMALVGQDAAPTADDNPIVTLHAYTDLVQVPTLVLARNRGPIQNRGQPERIAEDRFRVSVDGGPKFRVTHARLEGDDPISLSILLDLSQPKETLMLWMNDAIASLAPPFLTLRDRVSLYVLDCDLIRFSVAAPYTQDALKGVVDRALKPWSGRGQVGQSTNCPTRRYLWDTLAAMTGALSKQAGRRVILAVTDGVDRGSLSPWNEVRTYAQQSGVAIFGMTDAAILNIAPNGNQSMNPGYVHKESPFNSVCELSGGIVLAAHPKTLERQLQWFVTMVRGRYIVEFPHPVSTKGVYRGMEISIEKSDAFIRPAGASVPLDDPKILDDPTTVRSDSANAPKVGKRKVMAPN